MRAAAGVRVLRFPAGASTALAPEAGRPATPGAREFAEAWSARLARTPHANFTMSLAYLEEQAAAGEESLAALLDGPGRGAALVLRRRGLEWVSGFPWRWQCVFEDRDTSSPEGMTSADLTWALRHARRLAGARRLRFFAPLRTQFGFGQLAARTVLVRLAGVTEEQLLEAMDASRRRLARRSAKQGYRVVETLDSALCRDFEALLAETAERRHGIRGRDAPGEDRFEIAGRTWRKPWHWLLVAVRDGQVVAGLGLGRLPGGMVDGRASGSTPDAMKVGTNSQVWWEGIRQARLAGHSWFNLGGATMYKRQFGGVVVPVYMHLGGGPAWLVPNAFDVLRHRAVALAVRWRRRARKDAR